MSAFAFPLSSGLGSGFSFVPFVPSRLSLLGFNAPGPNSSGVDRLIDPVTLDYVRTDDGEWAETADSRTSVFIALSTRLGESAFDPDHGTAIAARVRSGVGLTPEFLQAETVRVCTELARDGILSDLRVTVRDQDGEPLRDQGGRLAVKVEWRDLSSGSPATTVTTMFAAR